MYFTIVITPQTLKERLDLIGRQLGLNTEIQDRKISLHSDAFHVDVLLGESLDIISINVDNQGDMLVRNSLIFFALCICIQNCYRVIEFWMLYYVYIISIFRYVFNLTTCINFYWRYKHLLNSYSSWCIFIFIAHFLFQDWSDLIEVLKWVIISIIQIFLICSCSTYMSYDHMGTPLIRSKFRKSVFVMF